MKYSGIELVDPKIIDLKKMLKQDLINFIYKQQEFYAKVADGIIMTSANNKDLHRKLEIKTEHLDTAQNNIAQAQSMLTAVIEGWDNYD